MTAVVIDASAGVEIVAETRRGQALARLIPAGSEGWVPEHFYAEVLAVLRRRWLVEGKLTESQATAAVSRLTLWHLHRASVAPLTPAAWRYRHNLTAADALYIAWPKTSMPTSSRTITAWLKPRPSPHGWTRCLMKHRHSVSRVSTYIPIWVLGRQRDL